MNRLKSRMQAFNSAPDVIMLPINDITTKKQIRSEFEHIKEFAESILSDGKIYNPLVVEEIKGGKYLLNQGERRLRAARYLVDQGHQQFEKVPCNLVVFESELKRFLAQAAENLSKDDVTTYDRISNVLEYHQRLDKEKGWQVRYAKATTLDKTDVYKLYNISQGPDEILKLAKDRVVESPRRLLKIAEFENFTEICEKLRGGASFNEAIKVGGKKVVKKKTTKSKTSSRKPTKKLELSARRQKLMLEFLINNGHLKNDQSLDDFFKIIGNSHK